MFFINQQCRLNRFRFSLLMLVMLYPFFSLLSFSQNQPADSALCIHTVFSGEYADIIRQRSNRSSTTLFARSFDTKISVTRGRDTLALAYSSWNQYASYNQYSSSIATSADNNLRSVSLQWISSIAWIDYSGTVLFPFSYSLFPLYYGVWIRFKPIEKLFVSTFNYERMPVMFSSALGIKEYSFPLYERSTGSAWNMTLESRPILYADGAFSWGKTITTTQKTTTGFSSPLDWITETITAQLTLHPDIQSTLWIGWEKKDEKGKASLIKDNLKFGSLSTGIENFLSWRAGVKGVIFSLPFSCEYRHRRWEGEVVGHIESWPFLSFGASVFANRINYNLSGSINAHELKSETSFRWGTCAIEPAVGLLYVLPNVSLVYREYDFFPIPKLITKENFSIQQCWLLRIGCKIEFPMYEARIALEIEQYVPVQLKDRQINQETAGPTIPLVSGSSTSTDGGRRIRVQVFLP